jgi:hypothetical protein
MLRIAPELPILRSAKFIHELVSCSTQLVRQKLVQDPPQVGQIRAGQVYASQLYLTVVSDF